ncbi:MAG: DUF1998 domain-containing protein [Rikenellaceae bacterium]|nr:DUF1998 domain-containing protein [Rikenellaceae bacterium]
MDIYKIKQYNQGIGKYKILSSTAGVGSIVTTKWGGFIMPLSISDWQFVKSLSVALSKPENSNHSIQQLEDLTGVEIIDDYRFIDFLKQKKQLSSLRHFVAIPHIQLNKFNQADVKDHPTNVKRASQAMPQLTEEMFVIPAINFPQWFISSNFELKPLAEWIEIWKTKRRNDGKIEYFAPPRDPNKSTLRRHNDPYLKDKTIYGLLKPVPMVLICPNGHISDIPWYEYFCAKLANERIDRAEGFELFNYDCKPCSCSPTGQHNLQWLSNRNQSESWGTIKCSYCQKSISLAGIMNIKPFCRGTRPWESGDRKESCRTSYGKTIMQMALVTSNSIYYANTFSSLYVPEEYIEKREGVLSESSSKMLTKIVDKIYPRYEKRTESPSKEDFWHNKFELSEDLKDAAEDDDIVLSEKDWEDIHDAFINPIVDEEVDILASYRFNEYLVFANNNINPGNNPGLKFEDIELPSCLHGLLKKIQKVETLAVTTTQLGFSRVTMPSPRLVEGKVVYPDEQIQPIYSCRKEDVVVLPANQLFGEGLFFMFDEEAINMWEGNYHLNDYYQSHLDDEDIGKFMSDEMDEYGRAKFYLLHTFSHTIMKELEFTCGYPTASLSERLYYSDKMCGVLIYTADGAEGSMGGLVWQGQPLLIERIIRSALNRALNCSSDPMCWENEDGLNRAACFSCAMISETSCEQRNLGLDRRALVDSEFGFFKSLL